MIGKEEGRGGAGKDWQSCSITFRGMGDCLQCFDAVGWEAGRASGL